MIYSYFFKRLENFSHLNNSAKGKKEGVVFSIL